MIKILPYKLFLFFIIFMAGCAGTKTTKNITEYPESRYMTAIGLGQSEQEARNQAVTEISRIFESKVFSDAKDRVKSVIDTSGKETYEQNIESNIKIISEVKLKGVDVKKTWFDDTKKTHYALAVLERDQAKENWRAEVETLDSRIEGEFNALKIINNKLLQLVSMKKIVHLWLKREVIISRLRVLGFSGTTSASYDVKSVFRKIPEIKKGMQIFVSLNGEHIEKVTEVIAKQLGDAGYIISKAKEGSDIWIDGTVNVVHVELNNPGWKFARVSISLVIKDSETGSTIGEISENTRAGHLNYAEAVNKAMKKITPTVSTRIVNYFR